MLIRRCAILFLEPRETVEFDLDQLMQGESGLRSTLQWFALAPHLEGELEVDAIEREVLGAVGEAQWVERGPRETTYAASTIDALLGKGLLIGDAPAHAAFRARDDKLRDTHWRPVSAASHFFNRWDAVNAGEAAREAGLRTTADLAERYGEPPTHFHARGEASARVALTRPVANDLDRLLWRRATCRNYDKARTLDAETFSRLLHTVFAAQAAVELAPNSAAVKKTSPSGGGLHPTEAYLLVQRVDGVAPGLYHYHSGEHALEPVTCPAQSFSSPSLDGLGTGQASPVEGAAADPKKGETENEADRWRDLAERFVAGQHWFADAQVLVILAPRFKRSFWKYRNHAKAYRALILDAGHLSQTLYVTATDLGLGAYITSAINEIEIERAFGLDPLDEGPLAVCGFGWRAAEKVTVEFDPLKQVWTD